LQGQLHVPAWKGEEKNHRERKQQLAAQQTKKAVQGLWGQQRLTGFSAF
jgi:hypothetical protein